MEIVKIIEYSYSYAEYQISDGLFEICCNCNSVPLPDDKVPQIGMKIKKLYIFSYKDSNLLTKSLSDKFEIQKIGKYGFQYKLTGIIYNKKESLIRVNNFIFSLEYYYPDGIEDFEVNDYVTIEADRIECDLEL